MLEKYFDKEFIENNLIKDDFRLYESIENREYWDSLKSGIYGEIKRKLSEVEQYDFRPLFAATLGLKFFRDGDRNTYQDEYIKRRVALNVYILIEAIENRGEYIDKIIDLVWLICEETSWVIPAHYYSIKGFDSFPDYMNDGPDLWSPKCANILCAAYHILKPRFDAISPKIADRIVYEIDRRIIKSYIKNDYYWWLGFDGTRVNNWNIWINLNMLLLALSAPVSKTEKVDVICKVLKSVEVYISQYPDDGMCDEGPGYWFISGLALNSFLCTLYRLSDGKINDIFSEKIRNIFDYVFKVYVGRGRFVNNADAASRCAGDFAEVYYVAKITENDKIMKFAGEIKRNYVPDQWFYQNPTFILLDWAVACRELQDDEKFVLTNPGYTYFPSVQMYINRLENGTFFSANGGNNDVPHNHNDVGNFTVFKSGVPFVIDVGSAEYVRDTFTERRYGIWCYQSLYHNVPEIGGFAQHNGASFCAKDVSYGNKEFSLEMKNAYENRKDVRSWRRSFNVVNNTITLSDKFELAKPMDIALTFMLASEPKISGKTVTLNNGGIELLITFDASVFDAETEVIDISKDRSLSFDWGESIYRLRFVSKQKLEKYDSIITIE